MKQLIMMVTLGLALLAGSGCSKDDKAVNGSGGGTFIATIDGVSFKGDMGASAPETNRGGAKLIIPGGIGKFRGNVTIVGLGLLDATTTTYVLNGSNQWRSGGVTIEDTGDEYSTNNPGSSGSVTISSYTSDRITGTFEFVAYANNGLTSLVVTDGQFDVPIIRTK